MEIKLGFRKDIHRLLCAPSMTILALFRALEDSALTLAPVIKGFTSLVHP